MLLDALALAQNFTLKSIELGGRLTTKQYLNGLGYTGENQSPQLNWEHFPAGTQCFAVIIYDFYAPTGSGLWHWISV